MSLAFVFLLVGYRTKVGLVPLHNWLPDAHAEGPTPVLGGALRPVLNVALYAVVRCKVLVEGAPIRAASPANMMMGFGLAVGWCSRPSSSRRQKRCRRAVRYCVG